MKIQRTEQNGKTLLTIEGGVTIKNAAELHKQLLLCMKGSKELLLDLSGIKNCDTAALQIFLSAGISASMDGKKLRSLNPSSAIIETASKAGLYQEHFLQLIEGITVVK